jgi:DNA-binding NarL/FixJ family response regulator
LRVCYVGFDVVFARWFVQYCKLCSAFSSFGPPHPWRVRHLQSVVLGLAVGWGGELADKTEPEKYMKKSVLLVDDHRVFLEALRRQLGDDTAFSIAGATGDLDEACALVQDRRPDIVLLDIDMGDRSGLDVIAEMRGAHPAARIIMLSMYDQQIFRDRSFELGADAYVTKGARSEALRAVMLGESQGRETGDSTLTWLRSPGDRSVGLTLSTREVQVARSVGNGMLEKEIADELGISVSSVSTYLRRAMFKMGIENRAELIRQAPAFGRAASEA